MEHLNEIIDAYLDGTLTDFDRERLEKVLADFPTLRSVVERRKPKSAPVYNVEDSDLVAADADFVL
jgi:hypothetical protein